MRLADAGLRLHAGGGPGVDESGRAVRDQDGDVDRAAAKMRRRTALTITGNSTQLLTSTGVYGTASRSDRSSIEDWLYPTAMAGVLAVGWMGDDMRQRRVFLFAGKKRRQNCHAARERMRVQSQAGVEQMIFALQINPGARGLCRPGGSDSSDSFDSFDLFLGQDATLRQREQSERVWLVQSDDPGEPIC